MKLYIHHVMGIFKLNTGQAACHDNRLTTLFWSQLQCQCRSTFQHVSVDTLYHNSAAYSFTLFVGSLFGCLFVFVSACLIVILFARWLIS